MVQDRSKNVGQGQENGGKGDTRVCWCCGKPGQIAAKCVKGSWNRSLNAVEEDKGDISVEVHQDDDELHAWCLLEESWRMSSGKKSPARNRN